MSLLRNIMMTLAYDGTAYHGFQKQNRTALKTVQQELETALGTLTAEEVTVYGSGRTDSGVHAEGQVINFHTGSRIPALKFPLAVNSLLPRDIVAIEARDVAEDFHARYSAKRKTYRYTIYNAPYLSPFWRYYAYHVPGNLDAGKMGEAAESFVGVHDFHGFCAKDTAATDFTRTIYSCRVGRQGALLVITVEGNGFLYNMVRIMAGTLLEIGQNKRQPDSIADLLEYGERKQAGMTLPPQGLCLVAVEYGNPAISE